MSWQPIVIQLLIVLGSMAGVYVFLVRPQLNRVAAHRAFATSLIPGDRVVTGGGLVGRITGRLGPDLLEVEVADGVRVQAVDYTIERRIVTEVATRAVPMRVVRTADASRTHPH